MTDELVILAVVLCVTSAGILVMGLLGRWRRLPRNSVFGIRTRATMESDAVWREVHARFAPYAYAMAAVFALIGVAPLVIARDAVGPVVVGGIVLALAVMVWGVVRAHRP